MKKLLLVALLSSSALAAENSALPPKAALDSITADDLLKHIKVLASDEYEGRAPGSKGEELSIKYIADQFKALGLKPGNPDGTYLQEVPLAGITTHPTAHFTVNGNTTDLKFPDDYVASSARLQENINVND
ncbi:MAG: peptidase M28, partial [Chthoniobacterales bacterium]